MSLKASSLQIPPTLSAKIFHPLHTVRCTGPAVFRNQLARDVACLLDVDEDVTSWSCLPGAYSYGGESYRPDFIAERYGRSTVVDVAAVGERPVWLKDVVTAAGHCLETFERGDLPVIRLKNGRDLLRYARYEVGLDDRVRLMAALDENGSLTVAECMPAFRAIPPMAGLASLILSRFVTIDLDHAPIGPETNVRRLRG